MVNEYLRRRRLHSSGELVTADVPETAGGASFDQSVVDRDAMWQALAALPPRQRAVLVLRYYEALPDAQIASLIGAKDATVRSLAARAFETLRNSELLVSPATKESTG